MKFSCHISFGALYFSHDDGALKQNVNRGARFEISRFVLGGGGSGLPECCTLQLLESKAIYFSQSRGTLYCPLQWLMSQ